MKVFLAIWAMKYILNISDKTYCNHVHFEIHKMLNFPKHLLRGLNIFVPSVTYEADYLLREHKPLRGQESLYVTKRFLRQYNETFI